MQSTAQPVPLWHKLIFVAALALLGIGYLRNLHNPLFDRHSFRQTQTAAVIDGLAAGDAMAESKLYVFGPPWVMPIEFPLYQKVVSVAVSAGVATPVAARIVSIVAFLGCLGLLRGWLRRVGFPLVDLTVALVALFPAYEMWSRACLIESTALLLSLGSLALFWGMIEEDFAAWRFVALLTVSTLATLQKLNAYLVVAAFVVFYALLSGRWRETRRVALLAIVWLVNIVALLAWGHVTDAARTGNFLAERLTGSRHLMMLIGTWHDRFSVSTYLHLLARGFLADALLVAVAFLVWRKDLHRTRTGAAVLSLMAAVAIVHLLFLKVYSVHDYYHFSTTVYVLVGAAFVTAQVLPTRFAAVALAAAALGCFGVNEFVYQRRLELSGTTWREPYRLIADQLRTTNADAVVLVLGDDWSSAVNYVSGRKTWAIPTWAMDDFLAAPGKMASGCHVSRVDAVVIMRDDYVRHGDLLRQLYGSEPAAIDTVRFADARVVVVKRALSFE